MNEVKTSGHQFESEIFERSFEVWEIDGLVELWKKWKRNEIKRGLKIEHSRLKNI